MPRYIDADELKRRFEHISLIELNKHATTSFAYAFGEAADMIDDMPTADVAEVKRGKWIVQDKGLIVTSYRCSECGRVVRDDTGYDVTIDYPYCHCGAKMDEVEA